MVNKKGACVTNDNKDGIIKFKCFNETCHCDSACRKRIWKPKLNKLKAPFIVLFLALLFLLIYVNVKHLYYLYYFCLYWPFFGYKVVKESIELPALFIASCVFTLMNY